MSSHANAKLLKIKACQELDPGAWPINIPFCCWNGGIDATWETYVGPSVLSAPVSTAKDIKKLDQQLSLPGHNFVYLWCFIVRGEQFYKVGHTKSMRRRHLDFLNTMPPSVMTHSGVFHLSLAPEAEVEDKETAFIIAARQFYQGNEWFSFEALGDQPMPELQPRPIVAFV